MKPTETADVPNHVLEAIEKIICEDCAKKGLKKMMFCDNEELPCGTRNEWLKIDIQRYRVSEKFAKRVNNLTK